MQKAAHKVLVKLRPENFAGCCWAKILVKAFDRKIQMERR
jgi:hypothetical protein